jgi:hypothetical protein
MKRKRDKQPKPKPGIAESIGTVQAKFTARAASGRSTWHEGAELARVQEKEAKDQAA